MEALTLQDLLWLVDDNQEFDLHLKNKIGRFTKYDEGYKPYLKNVVDKIIINYSLLEIYITDYV